MNRYLFHGNSAGEETRMRVVKAPSYDEAEAAFKKWLIELDGGSEHDTYIEGNELSVYDEQALVVGEDKAIRQGTILSTSIDRAIYRDLLTSLEDVANISQDGHYLTVDTEELIGLEREHDVERIADAMGITIDEGFSPYVELYEA